MNNFWKYFLIENGINAGISALTVLAASKIGDQSLQDAAQRAISAMHDFLELWNAEKANPTAK
jgi:hypothetical protein